MRRLAALAVLLAVSTTACGIEGQGVINGKWVDTPRGQVWCLGTDAGGLECDWDSIRGGTK